jgi:hypothetical protein
MITHNVNTSEQESKKTTPSAWQAKQVVTTPVASKENASNMQELDDAALREANGGIGFLGVMAATALGTAVFKGGKALVKKIRGK